MWKGERVKKYDMERVARAGKATRDTSEKRGIFVQAWLTFLQ